MARTAIIFGATGLVGGYLLENLLNDGDYEQVKIFVRQNVDIQHQKLKTEVIDFSKLLEYTEKIVCDDLFCCIGTTIKKAKTQENFRKVDFEIPVQLAQIAEKNKIPNYLVVSSIGANANSGNFYLRTKGQMEKEVLGRKIENISVLQPSALRGKRKERRLREIVPIFLFRGFEIFLIGKLKKYKSIHSRVVANALKIIAKNKFNQKFFESDKIAEIGTIS